MHKAPEKSLLMSIQRVTLCLGLWFSAVVLMSGTLICMSPSASGQETVGSITNLHGTATLTRNGRQSTVTLAMAVEIKDQIETSADSDVTVTLIDNGELLISEKSSVVLGDIMGGAVSSPRVSLLVGHVRTKVESALRRVAPVFTLGTPNAIAAVRGTDFETSYIEGKPCPGFPTCLRYTDVGVRRGRVEVRNRLSSATAPVVLVEEGYETSVPCEFAPAPAAPLGINDLIGPAYR